MTKYQMGYPPLWRDIRTIKPPSQSDGKENVVGIFLYNRSLFSYSL